MTAALLRSFADDIAAIGQAGSIGSLGVWAFLQVFVAFCLTVAGLIWLSRHKI